MKTGKTSEVRGQRAEGVKGGKIHQINDARHDEILTWLVARIEMNTRQQIITEVDRLRQEIAQLFTAAHHWNEHVRKPNEARIDPDPDGQLRKIAQGIDAMLATERGRTNARFKAELECHHTGMHLAMTQRQVAAWNKRNPVGTIVRYRRQVTTITRPAFIETCGHILVGIACRDKNVCLGHLGCTVRSAS